MNQLKAQLTRELCQTQLPRLLHLLNSSAPIEAKALTQEIEAAFFESILSWLIHQLDEEINRLKSSLSSENKSPRRTAVQCMQRAQQQLKTYQDQLLKHEITASDYQAQAQRALAPLTQGEAAQHQHYTRPFLVIANILIVLFPPFYLIFRSSIRQHNLRVDGWRGCFFSLAPQRVARVKQIRSLVSLISIPEIKI